MMAQSIQLAKRPHVIVGTPGRVVDHLTNTKVRESAVRAQAKSFFRKTDQDVRRGVAGLWTGTGWSPTSHRRCRVYF